MIVVLLDVGGAPDTRRRLQAQLATLPDRARVRVHEPPATDGFPAGLAGLADIADLAVRADENGEALAVLPDDLVVADRRIADLLDDPRPATRLLVTDGTPDAADLVCSRGRVVAAGSERHRLDGRGTHTSTGLLVVSAEHAARAAAAWHDAARTASDPALTGLDPLRAATVALVRADVPVLAVVAAPFVAGRGRPVADALAVDERDLVWRQASRGGDGVWSTFVLRPISRRVTRRAVRAGLRPNQVTVAGFAVGLAAAALVAIGTTATVVAGALVLQLALLLDCVDGEIARTTRGYTAAGARLDLVTDRVKEGALLAAVAVADHHLWPLALAGLMLQLTRHLADYAFADTVLALWRRPVADVRPFTDPSAPVSAVAADPSARGVSHWVRQAIHMQIGERWFVLTVGLLVAVATGWSATPLVAYVALVGFGLLWVLAGWTVRTMRSPRRREPLPLRAGLLVGALRDDGVVNRPARRPAAWLLAPLTGALEGAALLACGLATGTAAWAYAWGAVVVWHRYDIAYRERAGRDPVPGFVGRAGGGWLVRTVVVVVGAATGVADVLLPVGAAYLFLAYVPESLVPFRRSALRPAVLRRTARRALAVPVTRLLMRVVRPRRLALVAGLPDSEENALVPALALAARYPGEVVLVATDPDTARTALEHAAQLLGRPADRVRIVAKRGFATYLRFVRAELVLYTHGLYDSPRPLGRRLHANLWHGTGPKWNANANLAQRIGAQAHVTSSPTWGKAALDALRLPADARLVTGNPRQDVVAAAAGRPRPAVLDPDRPLVLWLPTFRRSRTAGVVGLREGEPLSADAAAAFAAAARRHDVQLIAKPHRLDAERFESLGVRVLTDADLRTAGVTLYELLGHAAGVVSDYSSVWVDVLDRPVSIGLHIPDVAAYRRERGLNRPDLTVAAHGLELTPADADGFFAAAAAGTLWRADARRRCLERIEYVDVPPGRRAARLLDDLAALAAERLGHDLGLSGDDPAAPPAPGDPATSS